MPVPVADDLDPDIRRFVAAIADAYAANPPLADASPEEKRAIVERVRAPWAEGGPQMARTKEIEIPVEAGRVCVRLYDPGGADLKPLLVYMHGGGWTFFSLDTHDRVMREYAAAARCVVAGVGYSLSPESKFPRALNEVVACVRWFATNGARFGADPRRISLGGDSAGGNLAVAAALSLRDAGETHSLASLLVNYGAFDDRYAPEAARFDGPRYMLARAEMDGFWTNYLGPDDRENPLARPIIAELTGLPPVFFSVAACDVLAEQNLRMADRLRSAGVRVRTETYSGAPHSFIEAAAIAPLAQRAIRDGAEWLRLHWDAPAKLAQAHR